MLNALRTLQLTGGFFVNAHFAAPWCIANEICPKLLHPHSPAPKQVIAFHYIVHGKLLIKLNDQPEITASAGDILVLPRSERCLLGSTLDIPPVDVEQLIHVRHQDRPLHTVHGTVHGGDGEETHLICGYIGNNDPQNAVLSLIPDLLVINVSEGVSDSWVETNIKYAAQELTRGNSASPAIAGKLAELLIMEAVRRYLVTWEAQPFSGKSTLPDPQVTKALGILHNQLDKRWTTDELASLVGLSRSAFADRFTRLIGVPPMQYLTQRRLEKASEQLKNSSQQIARIAYQVGYESEAAFSRAFKRTYGHSPAAWRQCPAA